jgi:hypothetical protein
VIEVLEGITAKYNGSTLAALTPSGMHSFIFIAEEGEEIDDYVVIYMDKTPIDNMFDRGGVDGKFIIEGVSSYDKGQKPINDIKNAIIALYDDKEITVEGYRLTHVTATHKQQVLDDSDLDNLLWRYPVAFEIKLTKETEA